MPERNLSELAEQLRVKFVGGRLCLDFVNTVGGRTGGAVIRDKIGSYRDLLDWSRLAGTTDAAAADRLAHLAGRHPGEAAAVLDRARRFREAMYRAFLCARGGRRASQSDAGILRGEIAQARSREYLADECGRFCWSLPARPESLDHVLWPIVLSASMLLTSDELALLGECAGQDCGWLFLDTSRNRRRRWCDMQDCGNRAKVRRFRAKTA